MKRVAILLVVFALTGCIAPAELSAERAGRIKTIGVASIMGPLNLEYAGATKLGNRMETATTGDRELNALIVDRVTEQLKARFDTRSIDYDEATTDPRSRGTAHLVATPADLKAMRPQGLDAYVLVAPYFSREPDSDFNLFHY